jgi:hypothetical protein
VGLNNSDVNCADLSPCQTAPSKDLVTQKAIISALYLLLIAVSLIPIVSVRYPESVDYLNHLGRLFVLTAPQDDPIHVFYQPDWHFVPNLGIDMLVLGFQKLMPLEAAMKVGFVIVFVSLPLSFVYLFTAVHRQIAPSLLVSTLCLSNFPLTAGFLSFYLGLAIALAAVGLWIRFGGHASVLKLLLFNAVSAVIVAVHAAALGALGLTIAAIHILRPPWQASAVIRRMVTVGCGFLAPLLLLVLPASERAGPSSLPHFVFDLLRKPLLLLDPVFSPTRASLAIGAAALIVSLFILIRLGPAQFDRRLLPALPVWIVVLLMVPIEINRAVAVDRRLVVFPVLLLLASLRVPPGRTQWVAAGLAAVAVCARVAFSLPAWLSYDATVAEFRALGPVIDPGAKLLIAEAPVQPGSCSQPPEWSPLYHHVPMLFMMDRRAFVPGLFAAPGPQPVRVTEPYRAIADPAAPVVSWPVLMAADTPQGRSRITELLGPTPWLPYFFGWRDAFDYLIVISLNCASDIPSDQQLVLVARSKTLLIYRITH